MMPNVIINDYITSVGKTMTSKLKESPVAANAHMWNQPTDSIDSRQYMHVQNATNGRKNIKKTK